MYCSVRIFRLCLGEDFVCSEGLNTYLFCVCKNCWRCHQREININKIFKESKEGIMRQIFVWISFCECCCVDIFLLVLLCCCVCKQILGNYCVQEMSFT